MRTPWSVNSLNWEQLQYVIYWKPAFNANCRSMKIYWWINNMQKLQQNNIFSNWNFSIIPSYHFFFRHTTNITAHANTINGNFISFDWMEIWCKLGSPNKFENDKLYSNATTQQNEREPGIVLDSRKNMMRNLANAGC